MEGNGRKLLTVERWDEILRMIDAGKTSLAELSEGLGVSEATIRRDLSDLEKAGKLRRVRGGAVRSATFATEPLFLEKASRAADAKRAIAEKAVEFIEDGDAIYLDGGSTIVELAKLLDGKRNLTVVTNSVMALSELFESRHKVVALGGEFRKISRTFVGPLTAGILDKLSIDKAFLGTIGFSAEEGPSTTDADEAFTKELVARRSREIILLADSSKIGAPSFASSGRTEEIDILITEKEPAPETLETLMEKGVELVVSGARPDGAARSGNNIE
jgi:DeoR/GlpR family transcriptional regulator of sugar metabolism